MFERFTAGARQAVVLAQEHARELRASHIGTEHLLLGLMAEPHGVAAAALTESGLSVEDVRAELSRIGPGFLGEREADALQAIGIDLEAVRSKAEEAFGRGALERGHRRHLRRGGRREARGHIPFSPRAKKVLELSLREALHLRHNFIGTEHILLGLLREGQGLALHVLTGRGIAPTDLRARVLVAVGKAA